MVSGLQQPLVLANVPKKRNKDHPSHSKNSKSPDTDWVTVTKQDTVVHMPASIAEVEEDSHIAQVEQNSTDNAAFSKESLGFEEHMYKGTQDAIFQLRSSASADTLERSRDSSLDRLDITYNTKFEHNECAESTDCDASIRNSQLLHDTASSESVKSKMEQETNREIGQQYPESESATFKKSFRPFPQDVHSEQRQNEVPQNTSYIPEFSDDAALEAVNPQTFKTGAFFSKPDSENSASANLGLLDDQIPGESPPWHRNTESNMITDPASAEYQTIAERTSLLGETSFKFITKDS